MNDPPDDRHGWVRFDPRDESFIRERIVLVLDDLHRQLDAKLPPCDRAYIAANWHKVVECVEARVREECAKLAAAAEQAEARDATRPEVDGFPHFPVTAQPEVAEHRQSALGLHPGEPAEGEQARRTPCAQGPRLAALVLPGDGQGKPDPWVAFVPWLRRSPLSRPLIGKTRACSAYPPCRLSRSAETLPGGVGRLKSAIAPKPHGQIFFAVIKEKIQGEKRRSKNPCRKSLN
jgi:hypothetical protein